MQIDVCGAVKSLAPASCFPLLKSYIVIIASLAGKKSMPGHEAVHCRTIIRLKLVAGLYIHKMCEHSLTRCVGIHK